MINKEELKEYADSKYSNVRNVELSSINPFNRDGINIIIIRMVSNGKNISTEIDYDKLKIFLRKKKLNKICKLIKN